MSKLPNAAVIGAGSSGIAAVKALHAARHRRRRASRSPTASAATGSSATRTGCRRPTGSCTSTRRASAWPTRDFPMPESYPDFPRHDQIAEYFDAYVDHFGFRDRIRFETGVERAERRADGTWEISTDTGDDARASTCCSSPTATTGTSAGPSPRSPAPTSSRACRCTRTTTSTTSRCATRTSSCSAWATARWTSPSRPPRSRATRTSPPAAARGSSRSTCSASRSTRWRRTRACRTRSATGSWRRSSRSTSAGPRSSACPSPTTAFGQAHPTVSGRIHDRIQHGKVTPRPNIARLHKDEVEFTDGTRVHADVVIYCTGYKITFPFFDEHVHLRARQPHRAVLARLRPGHREPRVHRAAPAARRDHAAGRGAGRVGRRVPARRVPATVAAGDARPHRQGHGGHAQALRQLQAPHDPGRLRRVPVQAREERREGARRAAAASYAPQVPRGAAPRSGRRVSTAPLRRPARGHQAGQPRGDPRRGARRVQRDRLRRGDRPRRHPRAPTSRRARSTTTSRTRSRCSARCSRTPRSRARARPRAPARGRRRSRSSSASGYLAYFAFVAEDRTSFELTRRNAGTVRAMFGEPAVGAGIDELQRRPRRRDRRRACSGRLDTQYLAAAMVGVGFEVGVQMLAARAGRSRARRRLRDAPVPRRPATVGACRPSAATAASCRTAGSAARPRRSRRPRAAARAPSARRGARRRPRGRGSLRGRRAQRRRARSRTATRTTSSPA